MEQKKLNRGMGKSKAGKGWFGEQSYSGERSAKLGGTLFANPSLAEGNEEVE